MDIGLVSDDFLTIGRHLEEAYALPRASSITETTELFQTQTGFVGSDGELDRDELICYDE